jgi:CBS domain-containing protein
MTDPGNLPELVRDLMTVGVATCSPDTPVVEIARLLVEKDLEALVVLDPIEGHALGIVGQDELVQAYTRSNVQTLKAEDILHDGVPQVPADIPLVAAAQLMRDQGVRTLFLMHHSGGIEYPAALISYRHILRHLAARSPEDLRDLGMHAQRQPPLQAFLERREAARKRNRLDP